MEIIRQARAEIPIIFAQPGDYLLANAAEPGAIATSSSILSSNVISYYPLWIPRPAALDLLVFEVTTAVVGATVRFGLYSAQGNGLPGDLITKDDSISLATTGQKNLTLSGVFFGLYYAALLQNAGSIPGLRSGSNVASAWDRIGASAIGTSIPTGFRITGQSILPNTATQESPINRTVNVFPIFWYRIAS